MAKLSQIKLGSTTYDIGAAWSNITGKPTEFPPSAHNHDFIVYKDTRALNESPDAVQAGLTVHLKGTANDGLSDGGSYHALLSVKDWGDYSGGPYWQSSVTANNNMYFRRSVSGAEWGAWQKILSDNNYTDYAATKDHNHDSTYLKLSGGTLTGLLNAHGGISLNASTPQQTPAYILGIKAFAEGGNIIWQSASSVSVGYADSAGTCTSLSTNAGSTTKAIYFTGGKPAQCNTNIDHNSKGLYGGTKLTSSTIDGFLESNVVKWATADSTAVGDNDGVVMSFGWSDTFGAQLWLDDGSGEGGIKVRNRTSSSWNPWRQVLTSYNYGSYAIPLSGGRTTGPIVREYVGHSWIDVSHGRNCGIKLDTAASGGSASCLWSVKTNTGAWGCGGLSNNDNLYFVWGSDTNYNAGTNSANSSIYFNSSGYIYATRVYNAVWNDYAEFRWAETLEPGRVVIEDKSGEMKLSTERLQPGGNIISDTYGHSMGETETAKTPLAVAGRVLAYTYEDRNSYPLGAAVCTGPNGTVSLMTREEIREYPERIIGTVSEIPKYKTWGIENIEVNGRIWIKVK